LARIQKMALLSVASRPTSLSPASTLYFARRTSKASSVHNRPRTKKPLSCFYVGKWVHSKQYSSVPLFRVVPLKAWRNRVSFRRLMALIILDGMAVKVVSGKVDKD